MLARSLGADGACVPTLRLGAQTRVAFENADEYIPLVLLLDDVAAYIVNKGRERSIWAETPLNLTGTGTTPQLRAVTRILASSLCSDVSSSGHCFTWSLR